MLANVLHLHTPLPPLGGVKKPFFFFSESSHVANQMNGIEAENTIRANNLPFYIPTNSGWGQKVKTKFLKKAKLHIKLKEKKYLKLCKIDLMQILTFWIGLKGQILKMCR